MKKTIVILTAGLASLALHASAEPAKPDRSGGPGAMLLKMDKNGDKQLTQDEVPAEAWARLSKADADGDGIVTFAELAKARPGGPGAPGAGAPGERLAKLDTNGDGKFTQDEMPAEAWARISKADANADGVVTREELAAAFKNRPGGGAAPKAPGAGAKPKRPATEN